MAETINREGLERAVHALQTVYNGVRYRSRAEARWAVFFDIAGIRVMYEPEGLLVGGLPYLPDFYAPDLGAYFEVKGEPPSADEIAKARALMDESGKKVFFLIGPPADSGYLADSLGVGRGALHYCRQCFPTMEWWTRFEHSWAALNPSGRECDGKTVGHIEAVTAARAHRFGVHD